MTQTMNENRASAPARWLHVALLAFAAMLAITVLTSCAGTSAASIAEPAAVQAVPATAVPTKAVEATAAFTVLTPPAPRGAQLTAAAVSAQDGVVTLPVADVSDGHAHFYTYDSAGKTISFFVLKSSDGVIRAAFDACDVCFPAKKGYRQEGDLMVCNNCGNVFPSTSINIVTGGCNPAALARSVEGDGLVIRVADLESGARFF